MHDATEPALPHWDLSPLYADLDDPALARDLNDLEQQAAETDRWSAAELGADPGPEDLGLLEEMIQRLNRLIKIKNRLGVFAYCRQATDSRDQAARRRVSEIEKAGLVMARIFRRFDAWLGTRADALDAWCRDSETAASYRTHLEDRIEVQARRMSEELEDLAADLLLAGGGSLWKLQQSMTSQLTVPFEQEGTVRQLPVAMLRNLAYDPDGDVRRRAYEAELQAWDSIREPVAFALNGVKGSALALARRRGRKDVLEAALDANRIDRDILDVLLSSMEQAFSDFRRYFQAKARRLGQERLPWWDLFAPAGPASKSFTWTEGRAFILTQFERFHPDLADFARDAFDQRWIDAEPREGKVGGGFCAPVSSLDASRILVNYDGSFDQLATLAHELGHAYHNHCQRGLPQLLRGAPSTLAETASTFCETLVFEAGLAYAPPEAQLSILETQLMGAAQIVVDISARYRFESEVLRRRARAELSADEFNEIMLQAQRETYGDGLDPDHLHPAMWILKPHYYSAEGNFYNFPYAFGLLLGLGLYARFREQPDGFKEGYEAFLRGTGAGKAARQTELFGIDLRDRAFWNQSLDVLRKRIDHYVAGSM